MLFKRFFQRKEISLSDAKADDLRGEWIAIIDGKIIAHSKNLAKVVRIAHKTYAGKKPTFTQIPLSNISVHTIH